MRARGWSQTGKGPAFEAEGQRLEPDAKGARVQGRGPEAGARLDKGQRLEPDAKRARIPGRGPEVSQDLLYAYLT